MSEMYTQGEFLADVANGLSPSRITIAVSTGSKEGDDRAMSVVKLALDLKSQPTLLLRSIVEEWDRSRIVREMY